MRDYFLRFTDRNHAVAELAARGIAEQPDANGQPTQFWQTGQYAVDMLGVVDRLPEFAQDPITGEPVEVSPAIPGVGYLVNLRWMDDEGEPEFEGQITPQYPKRIFA